MRAIEDDTNLPVLIAILLEEAPKSVIYLQDIRRLRALLEVILRSPGIADVFPINVERDGDRIRLVPHAVKRATRHGQHLANAAHLFANFLKLGVAGSASVVGALPELIFLGTVHPSYDRPSAMVMRWCAPRGKPADGKY